ncbi:helix-turn-helix transcriptional regulator [Hymenobacter glacialis]|uniref:HTH cro/C1-type domain-containing protein n=1 Tax=Hymenobacter glacialis TaxID=1908236 RepID=A0A1G1TDE4_9BACT|nr:helix-turn-helix transcriptional regulator [Hymenobacter glacialis]OGX88897.1 hypothetical protein BEN48_08090 [Hymenobacter glacialis]
MTTPVPVPIDQRFAQLIQQFGLTKNSFAISLGKTASVVQHLIDGRNKPGYDLLCRVFEIYPNVSRDWLLLGRGPMLVSGEPTAKPAAPAAPAASQEPPLEPIDLTDVELAPLRRSVPGVAGTRLQPAEIAATLALAAAANQPARTSATAPVEMPSTPSSTAQPVPATAQPSTSSAHNTPPPAPVMAAETAPPIGGSQPPIVPPAAPVATPQQGPVAAPPAPAAVTGPETYVAVALHAQHLQHQLALAELRNMHLQEQQQMLREMLAMARQGMV